MHGGDYNPEQWPPATWDDDVRHPAGLSLRAPRGHFQLVPSSHRRWFSGHGSALNPYPGRTVSIDEEPNHGRSDHHAEPSPSAAAPLTLDVTQYADAVNNAYYNQAVCTIATSNGGEVDLALKGSFMVWDKDHLAYWERGLNETLAADIGPTRASPCWFAPKARHRCAFTVPPGRRGRR